MKKEPRWFGLNVLNCFFKCRCAVNLCVLFLCFGVSNFWVGNNPFDFSFFSLHLLFISNFCGGGENVMLNCYHACYTIFWLYWPSTFTLSARFFARNSNTDHHGGEIIHCDPIHSSLWKFDFTKENAESFEWKSFPFTESKVSFERFGHDQCQDDTPFLANLIHWRNREEHISSLSFNLHIFGLMLLLLAVALFYQY